MPVKYLDGIQSTKSCKCVRGLTHVSADTTMKPTQSAPVLLVVSLPKH